MDRDDRLVTFGFLCPEIRGRFGTEYSDTHAGDSGHDPTHQCQLCREGEDSGLSGLSLSLPLLTHDSPWSRIFNSCLPWHRDPNVKCYIESWNQSMSRAAPVRLHGKGSSSSELRVQQSAFQRKPARVYSTPTLRENAGICTPFKETLSKWHLIIAVVGQKGQEGNTPRRQTIGKGCSKAIVAWVIFFLLLLFYSIPISSQHMEL